MTTAINMLLLFDTTQIVGPPPPGTSYMLTESNKYMITETGNYMITED